MSNLEWSDKPQRHDTASGEHNKEAQNKSEPEPLRRRSRLSGGIAHVVQKTRRCVIYNTTERRIARSSVVNHSAAATRQRRDGVSTERVIDADTDKTERTEAQSLSRPRCEIAAGPSTFVGDGSSLHGDEVRVVVPSRLGESLEEGSSTRS